MSLINEKQRIQWLDILRGIAILLVILFHFTTRYEVKYQMNYFMDSPLVQIRFGWIGVHLFFMISGFIIYLTIQKKKGVLDFLIARLSRLLPPYWVAIILIIILEYLHGTVFYAKNRNDLGTVLINVIMVPDILHVRYLDGAFWSLYVEIKFYLLFSLIWKFVDMKKHLVYYASFIILLFLATIHNNVHKLPLGDNLSYFLIFWTGIAACKVLYENMSYFIYFIITALTTISTTGFYNDGPELLIGIPVFSVLFLVGKGLDEKYPIIFNLFRPLSRLGRVSYSYYLIHQPIGYIVLGVLAGLTVSYNLSVMLAFVACFLMAFLGFKYIEQLNVPIASYLRSKINLS